MNILVTGGAGYIGSATVKRLVEEGYSVVVIDNLSKGKKEYIDQKAKFYHGDLCDVNFLNVVFFENKIDAVMHFAAYKSVPESDKDPVKYSQNITGTINLLNLMVKYCIKKIIYSSSAAVYGNPQYLPIDEDHPTNPINFYGFTKLECEQIINWYSRTKGIVGVCLRYFNVIGDAGLNYPKDGEEDIYSVILDVVNGKKKELIIYGNDYDTKDGTCVRDYIELKDLVKAHLSALNLNNSNIFNLGSGRGITILELIRRVEKETGKIVNYRFGPRREGDIVVSTAVFGKAKKNLGFYFQMS